MDHGHEEVVQLNGSKGLNEVAFPKPLSPDKIEGNHVYYTIRIQSGQVTFFENHETKTYGYNGPLLGPTIIVQKRQKVTVQLINELEEETTVHWHGLIIGGEEDGGPHQVIKPGEEQAITFTVEQEGAMLWFHPHPLHETSRQVYNGLAGLLYIVDEKQQAIPHTYGVDDFPLILQDKTFTDDFQLDYNQVKDDDGTTGNTLLINGVINPKLTLPHQWIRLRFLNGSNMRTYQLSFKQKVPMGQVASDGGLLENIVWQDSIQITPAERIEVVVDLTHVRQATVELQDDDGTLLLPIKIEGKSQQDWTIPHVLNVLPKLEDVESFPISKKIRIEGMANDVTLNGLTYDPDRIDFKQKQNELEVWEIENVMDDMGGMKHPFHIHGAQFKIISIDEEIPPAYLLGYKDTVSIEPGSKAKIAIKFPKKGLYMYHCHILEHEDSGMMGQILVE